MGIVDMGTKADEKNRKPLPGESKGAGVQSAKGGAIDTSQTMHSVNEQPVVPVINTDAQTEAIRNENKAKAEQALKAQAEREAQTKYTTTSKQTAPVNLAQFVANPYNRDERVKAMEKSDWLTKMNNDARDIENEYKGKMDKASKHAKMQAWGNMFSALGQLAGAGKNTYVAPDTTYFKSALAKADKAREMYDAIKASNKKNIEAAKQSWLAADEKAHMDAEETRRKAVKDFNDNLVKWSSENYVTQKGEFDPFAKQNADAKTKSANAAFTNAQTNKDKESKKDWNSEESRRGREKEAFYNYKDKKNQMNYNLSKSEVINIANIMKADESYAGNEVLGLLDSWIRGEVPDVDRDRLIAYVDDYLSKNAENPAVKEILDHNQDHYKYSVGLESAVFPEQ